MALYAEKLSLWEIAHRWYGEDPDKIRPAAELPLDVKDMLRNLCGAIWREQLISMLVRSSESDFGALPKTRVWEFHDEFTACCHGGVIDPKFLRFLTVDRAYFEIWCGEQGVVFPEFWKHRRWDETDVDGTQDNTAAVGPNAQPLALGGGDSSDSKSPQHQNAAMTLHGPRSGIKRRFVEYVLKTKARSYREAARRFIRSLSEAEIKALGRQDPERTLTARQ